MKKIEDKYKILKHTEHVLLRPGTYLGSNKPNLANRYLFDDITKKYIREEVTFIPSFIKIFDEIITNSVDESKRNVKLNQIKVNITDTSISVWDSGGIPVVLHKEYKQYVPEVIFGNLMSGSNYNDDEERLVAGTNGYGNKLTNIFSTKFFVETSDGSNSFTQTFTDNMSNRTKPVIKKSTKGFTRITYEPDFVRFGMSGLDKDHMKMLHKRVIDLAGCNSNIKFYFNDNLIQIKTFDDYLKYYSDDYIVCENNNDRWKVAVSTTDSGFQQISFANSCETYDGGVHVDYILNQIIVKLREFFLKKHKVDVKPSELKNHIFLFINCIVVNPSFSSQTKEKLITEVKDFGSTFEVTDKFIQKILKSEIVNNVLDWVNQKKLADESKLARDLNKNLSKIKVAKLVDAKGKERWKCMLCIFEGDSAGNACRKYRDAQTVGSFALRGKFTNVSEISIAKLVANEEAFNLMASLGLKLGEKPDRLKMRYGKVAIFADQDFDGYSIVALLINFFNKYWPELFDYNMIYKAETPIVVVTNIKNRKDIIKFYSQDEYHQWIGGVDTSKWDISFKKGLSALTEDEYSDIINNPRLTLLTKDDMSDKKLDIWFGGSKTSEQRKNEMLN